MSAFVLPVVLHVVWSPQGWLSPFVPHDSRVPGFSGPPILSTGAIDYAGAGVVHLTVGESILVLGAGPYPKGSLTSSCMHWL